MKRKEFEKIMIQYDLSLALGYLADESDQITNTSTLESFAKDSIDNGEYYLASHICQYLWDCDSRTGYWIYDYSMGTMDYPVPINVAEDVYDLLED